MRRLLRLRKNTCLKKCEYPQEDHVVRCLASQVSAADQDEHRDEGCHQSQDKDPLASPNEEPDRLVEEGGHQAHSHEQLDSQDPKDLAQEALPHSIIAKVGRVASRRRPATVSILQVTVAFGRHGDHAYK